MKDKTYRVSAEMVEKISKRNLKYIKKNGVIIPEAKMLAAILEVGLKREQENDIEAILNDENS